MKQHSPPEIWDELGVMIPLLDMLNHQTDAAQVTWEPPSKQELLDSNSSINSGDTLVVVVVIPTTTPHPKIKTMEPK